MGPDEDMTKVLSSKTVMICDECMAEKIPELFESEEEK